MTPQTDIIVGLGEVLWDVFPDAALFGGAPANFACHAAALGGSRVSVSVVSAVGNDDFGTRALASLESHQVDTHCLQQVQQPTGKVIIQLNEAGHATYDFPDDVAWDNLHWSDSLQNLAVNTRAVCFGSLAQRSATSRETIQKFLSATSPDALRVFDINLRPPPVADTTILESLRLANILKLNDEELPRLAQLIDTSGADITILRELANKFELQLIALTRGAKGAVLLRGNEVSQQAGVETEVVDTVGAGDAFTAALVLGILAGQDLTQINEKACQVAAYVCSQPGATPKNSRFPIKLNKLLQIAAMLRIAGPPYLTTFPTNGSQYSRHSLSATSVSNSAL